MKKQVQGILLSISIIIMISIQACAQATPEAISYGHDQCMHCKMTISDARFGSSLQTKKGRTCKFDDVQCMLDYVRASHVTKEEVAAFYLPDYSGQHKLYQAEEMHLLKSDSLRSPMRGNMAAFKDVAEWEKAQDALHGEKIYWEDLWK